MNDKDLLELWRFVKSFDVPKPERLCTFLVRKGGIKDREGELLRLLGGSRGRPGLVNNKSGLTFDNAAEISWEAGYIEGPPTISDLINAIESDLTTEGAYRAEDMTNYAQWREFKLYEQQLDEFGLLHLTSVAQVIRAVGGIDLEEETDIPF